MKKTKIIYWIVTGIMAAFLGVGSVFDAVSAQQAVDFITHIGYPAYLVPFLGIAKLLGIIAILVPGFPRLKEWAYAGLMYDLIGAMYSHISFGEPFAAWAPVFIPMLFVMTSYIFYHKLQKVAQEETFSNVSLSSK